jgi:hypothetical protein
VVSCEGVLAIASYLNKEVHKEFLSLGYKCLANDYESGAATDAVNEKLYRHHEAKKAMEQATAGLCSNDFSAYALTVSRNARMVADATNSFEQSGPKLDEFWEGEKRRTTEKAELENKILADKAELDMKVLADKAEQEKKILADKAEQERQAEKQKILNINYGFWIHKIQVFEKDVAETKAKYERDALAKANGQRQHAPDLYGMRKKVADAEVSQ